MDGLTQDRLLEELSRSFAGRVIGRLRELGAGFEAEVGGSRADRLVVSILPGFGAFLKVSKDLSRRAREISGASGLSPRDRHDLLLFRKHLEGSRVQRLERIPGSRVAILETDRGRLVLRSSGARPSASLLVEGQVVAAHLGGPTESPAPDPRPAADWFRWAPAPDSSDRLATARDRLRELPSLGPFLARAWDGDPGRLESWQQAAIRPCAFVVWPGGRPADSDLDLASAPPELWPFDPGDGRLAVEASSFQEAAAEVWLAQVTAVAFRERRHRASEAVGREARRLERLLSHLRADLGGLVDPRTLRRSAEALLAAPIAAPPGARRAEVPDPWGGEPLSVTLDPALSAPANADRLFGKARRMEQARLRIESRLLEVERQLELARNRAVEVGQVAALSQLPDPPESKADLASAHSSSGPRRWLTSRGLLMLVGRGARENHELTFGLARPEDLWLHAREVPGAHVILRDPEARAGPEDVRDAAEVAAFFSSACESQAVDVHVSKRKHLRSAKGSPGRVRLGHSETVRVAPRDPEGRLRRR